MAHCRLGEEEEVCYQIRKGWEEAGAYLCYITIKRLYYFCPLYTSHLDCFKHAPRAAAWAWAACLPPLLLLHCLPCWGKKKEAADALRAALPLPYHFARAVRSGPAGGRSPSKGRDDAWARKTEEGRQQEERQEGGHTCHAHTSLLTQASSSLHSHSSPRTASEEILLHAGMGGIRTFAHTLAHPHMRATSYATCLPLPSTT